MFIMVSLSIALLLKRRVFYVSLISGIWVILGIVNRVLLETRVSPFNASDLRLLDAGLSMVNQYFTPLLIVLVLVALAVVVLILVLLFIKGKKIEYKINYWKNLVVIGVLAVLCMAGTNIAIDTGFLATKFTNLTNAYNEYGFVYCFGAGLFNTGVKKPSDYSKDTIDEIMDQIDYSRGETEKIAEVDKKPNIIFLQLESFFDINKAKDIEFSSDPIPYFNQLKEKYTSGFLNVFNVGYGTCNTEFEIITSMNLDDFGPGELPYKSVLKTTTCESMAFDLKEYGYSTHAMHDNDATFYSRKTVFPHLGFDTFTSIEYMNIEEYTYEGWAKDKVLTSEIIKTLKSTDEPDYIYTISVQGHGSYPTSKVLEDPVIQVLSGVEDEGRKNAIEYYANQIHEMDEFIKELTEALDELGEDTILVMYGDHLPGLGFSEKDLENESLYQTEYVIWNNFGMQKEDEDIETFQLSPKVLESLGMNSGVINRYHQQNRHSEEQSDYLSGLQNLEYDILYGDQLAYGGISPYSATDMQMGVEEIIINKIEPETDGEENYVDIIGENFTKSSRVYVNGDKYDTEFIDTTKLRIKYSGLTSLDSFVVSQVDKDSGFVVGSTKECLYYGQ
jgi:phosphoglycerol transferase MdoB-like AlkP superfamily enzyme